MWKLARLFRICFVFVLLFSKQVLATKDAALFKVSDQVYFVSDAANLYVDVWTLNCVYSEATSLKIFAFNLSKEERELITSAMNDKAGPFNEKLKPYWQKIRNVAKLINYVNSLKLASQEKISKDLMELAKKSNCRNRGAFTEKRLEELMRLEIFLKSKTIDSRSKTSAKESDLDLVLKSVEKEFPHEDLW